MSPVRIARNHNTLILTSSHPHAEDPVDMIIFGLSYLFETAVDATADVTQTYHS